MTWTTNDHLPTTTKEFAEYLRDLADGAQEPG